VLSGITAEEKISFRLGNIQPKVLEFDGQKGVWVPEIDFMYLTELDLKFEELQLDYEYLRTRYEYFRKDYDKFLKMRMALIISTSAGFVISLGLITGFIVWGVLTYYFDFK
jgi:hypothetical protein